MTRPGTGAAPAPVIELGAYTLAAADRERALTPRLVELTEHHRARCAPYARLLEALGHRPDSPVREPADLPWLPAPLFKEHTLRSVPASAVFRVLASSGTTGATSRVHLDRDAAAAQQRSLTRSLAAVLGPDRLPMLVVDQRSAVLGPPPLPARGAAALGVMTYGRGHTFLLGPDGRPDLPALRRFLAAHGDRPFLVFGMTFLVWSVLRELADVPGLDLGNGVLLHTGGWKRLADQAVDGRAFRRELARVGLRRSHDFYGMVEQVGTVFLEGERTRQLYCPDHAQVIVREPGSWAVAPVGTPGVIEVLSTLPRSYPGHALLTGDLGVIHGVDDGDWPGPRFSVLGRVPRTELRGCGDVTGRAG
ncbi:acyl-protein synthetase [Streptomyces sp. DSM 44915]|uniref:Acyl-protein synthetase n=1 Tax=Streptomyces chisholmiae TaxID=3075540 RepID=A0ABU2JNM9_9ACTN|nr:acyl-protein synthetase [Streptomyces sp. DSM 44915]MDT0266592.1 acyl-protein synthetase [Streptomyces sp. DSM 44915]